MSKKKKVPKPTKAERFSQALRKFQASAKTDEDLYNLLIVFWSVIMQGDGMIFSEVRELMGLPKEIGIVNQFPVKTKVVDI